MNRRWLIALWLLLPAVPVTLSAAEPDKKGLDFFEKKIRPVLVKHCYECHVPKSEEIGGNLLLDTRAGIRKGGDSGHAVVPGNVKASLLIDALRFESLEMPPDNQLPPEIIANFAKWIDMGAPDPRDGQLAVAKADDLWSLKPLGKATVPPVKDATWPRDDLDRFILASLEKEGLKPVGDAQSVQLLRRVYLDLIGLPPSPAQIDAFLKDPSPKAYAAVVDSLLNSPQFGQRWGRHWMDVVRYAESNGKDRDVLFPHAWKYRDYVIDSINADKPYDRFLSEQLAGDLLSPENSQSREQLQIATGFLALTSKSFGGGEAFNMNLVDDQIDVTTRAMMGLTVSCARCHDHKFDPVPSKDYYALAGIFRSTQTLYGAGPGGKVKNGDFAQNLMVVGKNSEQLIKQHRDQQQKMAALTKQQTELQKKKIPQLKNRLTALQSGKPVKLQKSNKKKGRKKKAEQTASAANAKAKDKPKQADQPKPNENKAKPVDNTQAIAKAKEELAKLNQQLKSVRDQLSEVKKNKLPPLPLALGVREAKRIADYPVLMRGEVNKKGELAPRGFLTSVKVGNNYSINKEQSGRRQLSQWITDPSNPLTSRVAVNRIWHHLFGRGLVRTVDNFGHQGETPTHPELLDHLANRFMQEGWSTKKMIRAIVLSRTYQMSTVFHEGNSAVDVDNNLRWRQNQRRLDVEVMRDSLLAASGKLDLAPPPKGSPVAEIGSGEVGRGINRKPLEREFNHRSVYLPILRSRLPEVLKTFDFAEPSIVVGSRAATTIPAQALYFMNNSFVVTHAEGTAQRLLNDKKMDDATRINLAYKLCLARRPSDVERDKSLEFLKHSRTSLTKDNKNSQQVELAAWTVYCQALFATAEFRYVN